MAHLIDMVIADSKEEIWVEAALLADEYVDRLEDPTGSYHGQLTFHDVVCDNLESAEEYIKSKVTRSYDDHAVQFKDEEKLRWVAKIEIHC